MDGWVFDPGSTAGRASAHDHPVMIYWVLMNLVSQVNIKSVAIIGEQLEAILAKREGDEEPVRAWKEHNAEWSKILNKVEALSADCRLMHRRVDQIVSFLGIALYHPGMEQLATGGSGRHARGRNAGAPPMGSSMEAMQQTKGHGLSGIRAQVVSMLP